ncbi:neuronal acetylcholine receptor subunit beta-3-like [Mytilus trossulus]|uniref:neuronal acetylcholine receptor subunit beta-3-like n=1 Tax=Mytilus trossulus TaxID=6551 RepID=UPI00300645EF
MPQSISQTKSLHSFLFTDYNKNVKPVLDQSTRVNFQMDFILLAINEFDTVEGTLSLVGVLNCSWTDESLVWTPSSYGGLSSINVPQSDIWVPDIFISNQAEKFTPFGKSVDIKLTVSHSGLVSWYPGDVMKVKCAPNLENFPFDKQSCSIQFVVFGSSSTEVNMFGISQTTVNTDFFSTNKEWTLDSTSLKLESTTLVTATLNISRAWLYFTVTVLIPIYVIGLLIPLVFLLPVDSGERVSFSTSIFLSFTVVLTLVNSEIPSMSDPIPGIMIFIELLTVISGLTVVINVAILTYYFSPGEEVRSTCFQRFLCIFSTSNKIYDNETSNENAKLHENNNIRKKDVVKRFNNVFLIGSYFVIIVLSVAFTTGIRFL